MTRGQSDMRAQLLMRLQRALRPTLVAIVLSGAVFALHALSPSLTALKGSALSPGEVAPTSLTFEVPAVRESGPHALYVPSAGGVAGLEIGTRDVPLAVVAGPSGFGHASASFLLDPAPTNAQAATTLRVRLGHDHGRIGLSNVYVAPSALVAHSAKAQRDWSWRNQIISMSVAVAASFAFVMLIGFMSPHVSTGAMAALAYLVLAQALARERDVGLFFGILIDGAEYLLAIWVAFALTAILKSSDGVNRQGRLPNVLLLLSSAAVIAPQPEFPGWLFWVPAILAAPMIVIGIVRVWHASGDPLFSPVGIATALLALIAAGIGLVRAADPSLFHEAFILTTAYSLGALPLLTWGVVTLARHSFEDWRTSLVKLKADFAAQSVELGRVGALLEEEARRRTLFEERSRITRDMHDGIGGRLLSLLIRVRAGRLDIVEVEREVQESLNDLRLIVDSLDSAGDSMSAALNAFRARAERQLAGAGMVLDWLEDADALDGVSLEPQAMLDVFRILQESVSNAIGHSGARTVSVSVTREGDQLNIDIADDGRGLPPEAGAGRGKGLKNMKTRAARLGADLVMGSNGDKGHRITMALPLNRPGHSSDGSLSQPS